MKKYAFRLDSVLQHRERLEEEATQHLAGIRRRLAAEEDTMRDVEQAYAVLTETLRDTHTKLDHDDLRMYYARADYLARSIRALELSIINIRMEQEAARNELLKTAKDRRILETLKERGQADHTAQSVRLEHAHLDDANNRRSHFALEHTKEHS